MVHSLTAGSWHAWEPIEQQEKLHCRTITLVMPLIYKGALLAPFRMA